MKTRSQTANTSDTINQEEMASSHNMIQSLDYFHGDEMTAENFISRFTDYCNLNKVKDEEIAHYFKLLMRGNAYTWVSAFKTEELRNLESVTKLFRERFLCQDGALISQCEFYNRKMRPGESPEQFMDIIISTGRSLRKTDAEIKSIILQNISRGTASHHVH